MPQLRIGISGWRYEPWRGVFYPSDLIQKKELFFASRQLNSIELNGSFYALQRPSSYRSWAADTPDGFVFSIKGPRYITHLRRLRDVDGALANFFASGLLSLGKKLGPFLWQFPPNLKYDAALFESFFNLLPRDIKSAATLGQKHERWLKTQRIDLNYETNHELRHAVEIRHESFRDPSFIKLLRKHDIALVVADTAGKWPLIEELTSDFVYLRLHGDEQLYVSGYTEKALDGWAERIEHWRGGGEPKDAQRVIDRAGKKRSSRDVFVYFDNDVKVKAPRDARRLMEKLGLTWEPETPIREDARKRVTVKKKKKTG